MFIGEGVVLDSADVDAALVGKGRLTDIRLVAVMRQICQFIDKSRGGVELIDMILCLAVKAHLEYQCRQDGGKVGVAASLSVTVNGALNMVDSLVDCDKGVGDS